MKTPALASLLLVSAPAIAQVVTANLIVLTPFPITATAGGQTLTQTVPAGPVRPDQPQVILRSPFTAAALSLGTVSTPNHAMAWVWPDLYVSSANASAQIGPADFLVRFTSSVGISVGLDIDLAQVFTSAVSGTPALSIDLGNDGTVDYTVLPVGGLHVPSVSITPQQPYEIRVQYTATVAQPDSSSPRLEFGVRPISNVAVITTVIACPANLQLGWAPAFADYGIDLGPPSVFCALVLGLQAQPALFPTLGSICVLWPSPDVVLAATGAVHIPLPAAVRPVTLWAQGVVPLTTGALLLTNALQIYAQ